MEKDRDTALISIASNKNNAGRAYWSGFNSGTSHSVDGLAVNTIGEKVCTGGAKSGTHCGLEVVAKNFAYDLNGVTLVNVVKAEASTGFAAAQGDSGGPVYRVVSSDRIAKGLIAAAPTLADLSNSNCAGGGGIYSYGPTTLCTKKVIYVGIKNLLPDLNVKLR